MSDSKKGENAELRTELNSEYKHKRKEAVKRTIANMTVGKDVSPLFADVVKNMQTDDLEMKKLVYLYLINYARVMPELVILVVNTFIKDCGDANPLVRGLAIRTMGCLRSEKILDYLLEPLKKALQDIDPYVRKTAALCVAKMHDISPSTTQTSGLHNLLIDLLSDKSPIVISNAVAALTDLADSPTNPIPFLIDASLISKLLTALNECTEWGQICILTCVGKYVPGDLKEAGEIVERVSARLQHANAGLVMNAIRVIMMFVAKYLGDDDAVIQPVLKKITPSLVTLLSSKPEIQYIALRNINLLLLARSSLLSSEIRVFFIKYTDPPYVKFEKLLVLEKLCTGNNVDVVLGEFKEYAAEVDVEFVRRVVRGIGGIAVKPSTDPSNVDKCVNVLLEMIKGGIEYVIEESAVVLKYPGRFGYVIPRLCECLPGLNEGAAIAALVYMVGENLEAVPGAVELLAPLISEFLECESVVQMQLLAATVKMYLKQPNASESMLKDVLRMATTESDNCDLRDRAFLYWRLLSSNMDSAKMVVFARRVEVEFEGVGMSGQLLDELVGALASLASVHHISPRLFSNINGVMSVEADSEAAEARAVVRIKSAPKFVENLLDFDDSSPQPDTPQAFTPRVSPVKVQKVVLDLLGMDVPSSSMPVARSTALPQKAVASLLDENFFGGSNLGSGDLMGSAASGLDVRGPAATYSPLADFAGLTIAPTKSNASNMGSSAYGAEMNGGGLTSGFGMHLDMGGIGSGFSDQQRAPVDHLSLGIFTDSPTKIEREIKADVPSYMHEQVKQDAYGFEHNYPVDVYPASPPPTRPVLLSLADGNGLEITGSLDARSNPPTFKAIFTNKSANSMHDFAIQFNQNAFGLACDESLDIPHLAPGANQDITLRMHVEEGHGSDDVVQVAVKSSSGVTYFSCGVDGGLKLDSNDGETRDSMRESEERHESAHVAVEEVKKEKSVNPLDTLIMDMGGF